SMLLTALAGAYDLDIVAGAQRRLRPGSARDDRSVDRDRNPPLAGINRFLLQQCAERGDGKRLVLTVDPDACRGLRHAGLPHSAAARGRDGANLSMLNGRSAGSVTPSRISCAIASAVTGARRIPLRWWPVA